MISDFPPRVYGVGFLTPTQMTHGSLFSGIGGFDLAAQLMGWTNVFHCELNPFGQKILHHYWPNAIQYYDITKTDFTIHRGAIDVLTGGFPCQPYSMAGKRLGKEDERHLWPEMLRAIREIQPRWVVGENVLGLVNWSGGLVFHEVQADLEAEGYEVQPFVLPAAAVNAPHRRDRVWFVAYAKGNGSTISKLGESESRQQIQTGGNVDGFEGLGVAADTCQYGFYTCKWAGDAEQCDICEDGSNYQEDENADWDATDSDYKRQQQQPRNAFTNIQGQFSGSFEKRGFDAFPTVSPICHADDGLSDRLDNITFSRWRQESIKGGGNAVVPQVVLRIFETIEEYENQWTPTSQSDCSTSSSPD